MPKLLLIDPAHFDVSYAINPWMQPDAWGRDPQGMKDATLRSFGDMRAALEGAGCEVVVAPGAPGLPDMVFPANATGPERWDTSFVRSSLNLRRAG